MKYLLFILVVVLSSCAQKQVKYKPDQIVFYKFDESESRNLFLLCKSYSEMYAYPTFYGRDESHHKFFFEYNNSEKNNLSLFLYVPCINKRSYMGVTAGVDITRMSEDTGEVDEVTHVPHTFMTNTHNEAHKALEKVTYTPTQLYDWYKDDAHSFKRAFLYSPDENWNWNEDIYLTLVMIKPKISLFEYKQFHSVMYDWVWMNPPIEKEKFGISVKEIEEELNNGSDGT